MTRGTKSRERRPALRQAARLAHLLPRMHTTRLRRPAGPRGPGAQFILDIIKSLFLFIIHFQYVSYLYLFM